MNLNDYFSIGTKVYCAHPKRGYGYIRDIINEGTVEHFYVAPLYGYFVFECWFNDSGTTGVFYLHRDQVLKLYKNLGVGDEQLLILHPTWQWADPKYRTDLI